jgi:hypothetical protein
MVSPKLIHQIEDHWEAIAARTIRRARNCTDLPHLRDLPASEVQLISQRTLHNLGEWLHNSPDRDITQRYEEIGRQRLKDGMLLHEAVRGMQLMKESTLEYIREEGFTASPVEILAEEELEFRLGRFFDRLVFHLVKGYEVEMRREMGTAKGPAGIGAKA